MKITVPLWPTWLLTLMFVVARLVHYTTWHWYWVVSPLWITVAFVAGVFGVVEYSLRQARVGQQ